MAGFDPALYRRESRERWGSCAGGWAKHDAHTRRAAMPVSAWLVDALAPQPGHDLLELGAGVGETGFLAAELIAPTGTLVTSDFSPEMLTAAQRRAEELGLTNVRFKQIDAETSIDLPTASVDGVVARWVYMLLADPDTALRETRRVLRPGGRLALAAWAPAAENPWASVPVGTLVERGHLERPGEGAPGQFAWAREDVIAERLHAAGFADVVVDKVTFTYRYADVDDWWQRTLDMSMGFARTVPALSSAERAAVRRVMDEAAARYVAPDATLAIPAASWTACASA